MRYEIMILIGYVVIINIVALVLMGEDKRRARKNLWRISERMLFVAALIGGSIGGLFGMYCFRHKTKHWQFRIGFPVILCVQIALAVWIGIV